MNSAPNTAWKRRLRQSLALTATAMLVSLGVVSTSAVAHAADGDYTVEITAPATIPVYDAYNYVVTLSTEVASGPANGIVLTATLPVGINFDAVDTGPASNVASYDWNTTTRVLTLTMKPISEAVSEFSFSVRQANDDVKYPGMPLEVSISGTPGTSGATPTDVVTTELTGNVTYNPRKSFTTVFGSDNRTVTYTINGEAVDRNGATTETFYAHSQTFVDELPAGAVVSDSTATIGAWTFAPNPVTGGTTATWTNDDTVSYNSPGVAGNPAPTLTVQYPIAAFPGTEPPANTVQMLVTDAQGTSYGPTTASVQPPPFADGSGTGLKISKSQNDTDETDDFTLGSGRLIDGTLIKSSFIGGADDNQLESMTIEDSSAHSADNAEFYEHANSYYLHLRFSAVLKAANVPYEIEYTTNAGSTWQSVNTTGKTTAQNATYIPRNETLGGWDYRGTVGNTNFINLPVGEYLTGWRVVVSPDAATTIPSGSEVRVIHEFFSSMTNLIDPSVTPAAVDLVNTATVAGTTESGEDLAASDLTTIHIRDRVNIVTGVTAPSTLTVGSPAVFKGTISNQDPAGTAYPNSVMKVVLPVGVTYDASVGITADRTTAEVSGVPVPTVGNGLTITTETVTDADGEHQVVVFTFDSLESVATVGTPTIANAITGGFTYSIPTQVLPQAYKAGATEVPVTSWAFTNDPAYATMNMDYYGTYFAADSYEFGQTPNNVIAKDIRRSVVITAGGLLIGKQVRESPAEPWSVSTTIGNTADWQVYVTNALVNTVTDAVLFDRLPYVGDDRDSEFNSTLTSAVTGFPADAVVEYSTDATSATTGTWTNEPVGATAFRVSVPSIASGDDFTLLYTTSVPAGTEPNAFAANNLQATGTYNDGVREFDSNLANARVLGGDFSLSKSVEGAASNAVPAGTEFTIEYSYGDPEQTGELIVLADGTVQTSDELPLGSVITLNEPDFPEIPGVSWGAPTYVINGGDPTAEGTFVIEPSTTVAIEVINTANVATGDFSVSKSVVGDAAASVPDDTEFTVGYSYGDPAVTGTLTVLADGTVVTSDALPNGTEVTLTEVDLPEIEGVKWGTPKFTVGEGDPTEQVTLTIGDGTTVAVKLVNIAQATTDVTAPPQPPTTTKNPLPTTGSDTPTHLSIIAAVALLLGGGLIVLRRRFRAQK